MTVVRLVRHGHAGSKKHWTGDDADRPLDARGRAEAEAIGHALADAGAGRLRSSPMRRCIQTLEPLAAALGRPIDAVPLLGPESGARALRDWLATDTADGDVLCTHGETMARLLDELGPRSIVGHGNVLAKGTFWDVELSKGRIRRLTHRVPE